jgi:hypothetical protein
MGFSAWIPAFPANLGLANRQRSRRNVVHQVAPERLGGECCKPVDKNFLKIIAVIFYGKFGQGVLARGAPVAVMRTFLRLLGVG